MEPGECSGAKSCDELWAKLVPSDSRYSDVEVASNEMVVCSEVTCSSVEKHEWCKITRNPDLCSATMQNVSSNTIIVDGTVLGKEDTVVINCGSEIISGSDREGYLIYRFDVIPTQEQCKKQLKISLDVEHAKCSICLNIWHDVVTVAPCLHNFCNGCFSEWLRRSQEKQSSVICPQCRAVVHFVGRNHFLRNIEEDILQSDSNLRRSSEEVALLDGYASIKSNLVIKIGKTCRKRPHSPPNEESNGTEFPCPQCGTEFGGFQCNRATAHLQCQACGGMMPSRTDISVPQHCLGCDRAFCGAYWQAQGVVGSDFHTVCIPESFKPISQHVISRIPFSALQNNRYEQDITERCIRQTGKTLQDVISEWIAKLNNREIVIVTKNWFHFSCTGFVFRCPNIFYHLMHLKGKTAGMVMHVVPNITVKNMLVKEIMYVVQPRGAICSDSMHLYDSVVNLLNYGDNVRLLYLYCSSIHLISIW